MLSYIYMKILESSPDRYDRGISWLSLGHIDKIKRHIAENLVTEGTAVLEIGAGTATLALLMARKGAAVTGFDISPAMLEVARTKIDAAGCSENIDLVEMGVSGMDRLLPDKYDLVVATLVFSELSKDEQVYALHQAFRILKPGGQIVIADEIRPGRTFYRLLYFLLRLPLFLITFLVTQTTTKAVQHIEKKVASAGFAITRADHGLMGSFVCLEAQKPGGG